MQSQPSGQCIFIQSHYSKISSVLKTLREDGEGQDVNLQFGSRIVGCHKCVLSSTFPYFEAMFTSSFKESSEKTVRMNDVDGEAMRALIMYAYSSSIFLTPENAEKVARLADMLGKTDIVSNCYTFLLKNITASRCTDIMRLAYHLDLPDLYNACVDFIRGNASEIQSKVFNDLLFSEFKELLTMENPVLYDTLGLFRVVLQWVEHDAATRKECLPELLECLHLEYLSMEDLKQNVRKHESRIIKGNPRCSSQIAKAESKCKNNDKRLLCLGASASKPTFTDKPVSKECSMLIRCYEAGPNKWSLLSAMPDRMAGFAACCVDEAVYVTGGNPDLQDTIVNTNFSVYYFDAQRSTFLYYPRVKSQPRHCHAMNELHGDIYFIGGVVMDLVRGTREETNAVDCYNLKSQSWKHDVCSMNEPRHTLASVSLDGAIYALGGRNSWDGGLSSCEKYDPETNSWTYIAPMNVERCACGAAVLKGHIYVLGGMNSFGEFLSSVEVYNPGAAQWTVVNTVSLPCGRAYVSAAVADSRLYTAGGCGEERRVQPLEVFDVRSMTWKPVENSPCLPVGTRLLAM